MREKQNKMELKDTGLISIVVMGRPRLITCGNCKKDGDCKSYFCKYYWVQKRLIALRKMQGKKPIPLLTDEERKEKRRAIAKASAERRYARLRAKTAEKREVQDKRRKLLGEFLTNFQETSGMKPGAIARNMGMDDRRFRLYREGKTFGADNVAKIAAYFGYDDTEEFFEMIEKRNAPKEEIAEIKVECEREQKPKKKKRTKLSGLTEEEKKARQKEYMREYAKAYYKKNRERVLENRKKYCLKNREKRSEYMKEYHIKNRERRLAYMKVYWARKKAEKDE